MKPLMRIALAALSLLLLCVAGCDEQRVTEQQSAAELRAAFPERAAQSLGGLGFQRSAQGFAPRVAGGPDAVQQAEASLSARGGLRLQLPLEGSDEAQFDLASFTIRVREIDARGRGQLVEKAVAYERPNGTSLWSVTEGGYEEWLRISQPDASPVASWEVSGASLHGVADGVELLDDGGRARIAVRAPAAYGAGDKPGRAWLAIDGSRILLYTDVRGPEALVDPTWTTVGNLNLQRSDHTATLLLSGKVLVAGGRSGPTTPVSSSELYDPTTGTWSTSGLLNTARCNHTATLLPSGKVLVAGGYDCGATADVSYTSAELYDPSSQLWTNTSHPMNASRRFHTATLLPSGKVLVTGGSSMSGNAWSSAELYDPSVDSWTALASSMNAARTLHTATLLKSGKVLLAAGLTDYNGDSEVFDPFAKTFTMTDNYLGGVRFYHTATLLPSGKVLLAGGQSNHLDSNCPSPGFCKSYFLYDPSQGTNGVWSAAGAMGDYRAYHSATLLPSGKVLVTGGQDGLTGSTPNYATTAELYDPTADSWSATASPSAARAYHTATVLGSGKVLIAGGGLGNSSGYGGATSCLNSTEQYDPNTGSWANTAGTLSAARAQHTATLLTSGKVLVAGGFDGAGNPRATAELFDPSAGTWTSAGSLNVARGSHTATLLPTGLVLVAGGYDGASSLASAELFDGTSWTLTGSMSHGRKWHTANLVYSADVIVVGGHDGTSALASTETYDPGTGTWAVTSTLNTARYFHTATLLPNGGLLVVSGISASGSETNTCEILNGTWSYTGGLSQARHSHTATLLPSGKVLVAGGSFGSAAQKSAELFDPSTSSWSPAGNLTTPRTLHTATLLRTGNVLVAGGTAGAGPLSTAEQYDPGTGAWTATASLSTARYSQSATLLPNGTVLAVGGMTASTTVTKASEVFDEGRAAAPGAVPTLTGSLTSPVLVGATLTLNGTLFTGISETSSGSTQASATNYPLIYLEREDSEQVVWDKVLGWNPSSAVVALPASLLPRGWYWLSVVVNGVPSGAQPLLIGYLAAGQGCTSNTDCTSNACEEGTCCQGQCGGVCQTCTAIGACVAVVNDYDPDTCTGPQHICDSTGNCKLTKGQACGLAADCASGICDERCCTGACNQTCKTCNASGACVTVTNADDPNTCTGTKSCDASGNCKLKVGQPCGVATDCLSSICDENCCSSACSGTCKTCNSGGACVAVINADDPDSCTGNNTCDGSGNCKKKPGQACSGTTDCASGICDENCCSSACSGTCKTCNSGGACVTVTNADDPDSCTGTTTCDGSGNCKKKPGQACSGTTDCASGICDENCCSSACSGTCKTCNTGGACVTVANADDPDTCTGNNTCDASGNCKKKPGQACSGTTDCASGICDENCCSSACSGTCKTCNSGGACVTVTNADDPDSCTGTNTCDASGNCKKKPGQACSGTTDCASGICDENCCSSACSGTCKTCNAGGACVTVTNADDPDSCTGNNTCDASGNCKKKPGQACSGTTDCASGICDENCCSSACSGTCKTCNSGGACVTVTNADDPDSCTGTNTCDASGNCKKKPGQACSGTTDCASGICDENCCSSACSGTCKTCNSGGACVTVTNADDPDTCTGNNTCDASGNCKKKPGQACSGTTDCASGICDENCCSSACSGTCKTCNAGGACVTVTNADDQDSCTGTNTCDASGNCKKKPGQACSGTTDCASGICDENCCSSACSGTCKTCNTGGACVTVANADDPDSCTGNSTCDASGNCKLKVGQPCSAAGSCVSGICDENCCSAACSGTCKTCNASGACVAVTNADDPDSCTGANSCDASGNCKLKVGQPCSAASSCVSGICDEACCLSACNGVCQRCDASGACLPVTNADDPDTCTPGTSTCDAYGFCKKKPGQGCTDASQCASGVCDEKCCSSACSGSCRTCDATGACVAVTNADDADTCTGANTCDGSGNCKRKSGQVCSASADCASGSCSSDHYCCASACGPCGTCSTGICATLGYGNAGSPACVPYVCSGVSDSCPGSCAHDSDCVSSDYCSAGLCQPKQDNGAVCTAGKQCSSAICSSDGHCCNSACGPCGTCSSGACSKLGQGAAATPACAGDLLCSGASDACPGSCSQDGDCVSGDYCSQGKCAAKLVNGGFCTAADQCASGTCSVDGYCCATSCGPCGTCATGTCANSAAGSAGSPACAPYVCDGNGPTCPKSCADDGSCISTEHCTNNQCGTTKPNGMGCSAPGDCASGNCVAGICCNSACGACGDCSSGACGNASAGTVASSCAPFVCSGTAPACPASCTIDANCVVGDFCSAGACSAKQDDGKSCAIDGQCKNGHCVWGVCCDNGCGACGSCATGACSPLSAGNGGAPSCSPLLCDGTTVACPAACGHDTDCIAGDYCASGACTGKLADGQDCATDNACANGHCFSGKCCNSACGACGVCSTGTCTPVSAGSAQCPADLVCDGQSPTCPAGCTSDTDCLGGDYCDAAGSCQAKQTNGAGCATADECLSARCSGDGYCCSVACGPCGSCASGNQCSNLSPGSSGSPSCSPYLCSGQFDGCPTGCASSDNCIPGDVCNAAGRCVVGGGADAGVPADASVTPGLDASAAGLDSGATGSDASASSGSDARVPGSDGSAPGLDGGEAVVEDSGEATFDGSVASADGGPVADGSAAPAADGSAVVGDGGAPATGDGGLAEQVSLFGCSCGSVGGASPVGLLVVVLWALRRRRRAVGLAVLAAVGLTAAQARAGAGDPANAPASAKPKAKEAAVAKTPPEPPAPAEAKKPKKVKVAVLMLAAGPGVDGKTAALITDMLSDAVQRIPMTQVISAKDIEASIGFEKQRELLGCTDATCLAEVGGALGVDKLVNGTLGRLGQSIVLTVQLLDAKRSTVERRFSSRARAATEEAFLDLIAPTVQGLFGEKPPEGEVAVAAKEPEPASPRAPLLSVKARGQFEAASKLGMAGAVLVGVQPIDQLRISAGALLSKTQGAVLNLSWIPINGGGRVYPLVGVEAPLLFAPKFAGGVGLNVGVEFAPISWLTLGVEVPAYYFFAAPDANYRWYFFVAGTASVRFL